MTRMTSRQRLQAIFRGQTPDRPGVKIWGVTPGQSCCHPAFEPVRDAAAAQTDLFLNAGSPFHLHAGRHAAACIRSETRPTALPEWEEVVTTWRTPLGDLREIFTRSTCGKPGYEKEYLLKEPGDIRKLLSLPYEPCPFSDADFRKVEGEIGERGITLFWLDHPMYGLQRLIGSENFALWSLEAEELILEAIAVFAERIHAQAAEALAAGVRGPFAWVGPELCIPPLMSPAAFDRYVTAFDQPLIARIHDAGGWVWVHCHGKMRPVLERFQRMGVDVLNPLEPPPMGDMTMAQAFAIVGDRMGLEGGIETHDLMTGTRERLYEQIHAALDAGRGRCMILGPSSGYMESVTPTPREIENWLFYIAEGIHHAEALAR